MSEREVAFGPQRFQRGDFALIWESMASDVWLPLAGSSLVSESIFGDLLRDMNSCLRSPIELGKLAEVLEDPIESQALLFSISSNDLAGEFGALTFLVKAFDTVLEDGGAPAGERFAKLVQHLCWAHGLRYEVRLPFELSISASGMLSALSDELSRVAKLDPHTLELYRELQEATHDVRHGATPARMKKCIHTHFNLLEALAATNPGVKQSTLGGQIVELKTWPHAAVREALSKLYGFASDYPGIRHGGNPRGSVRELDIRDLVGVTTALVGFVPYLSGSMDLSAFQLYRAQAD